MAAASRKSRVSKSGDPLATRAAILTVVDSMQPTLRIFFGEAPLAIAKADYAARIATWEESNAVSLEAQG